MALAYFTHPDCRLHDWLPALAEADCAWVTERIREVAARHARGRIVSVPEGGYALHALGRSVAAHLRILAGL